MSETVERLQTATAGLLWTSEADYPFEIFEWTDRTELDRDALLNFLALPPDTQVEHVGVESFFEKAMRDRDWYDEVESARAQRFRDLVAVLHQTLSQIRVFCLGTVEIDVYIVGRSAQETWAGLHTHIVET
ncbi:MAG: nuclease A inhibitor family protein [Cyanobacteria bacterium P01_F01_bin.33]